MDHKTYVQLLADANRTIRQQEVVIEALRRHKQESIQVHGKLVQVQKDRENSERLYRSAATELQRARQLLAEERKESAARLAKAQAEFEAQLIRIRSELVSEVNSAALPDKAIASLRGENASLKDDIRRQAQVAQGRLDGQRVKLQSVVRQCKDLARRNRKLEQDIARLRTQSSSDPPARGKKTSLSRNKPASLPPIHELEDIPAVRRLLRKLEQGDGRAFRGKSVALLGHSPYSERALRPRLAQACAVVADCGDPNASILIVGRLNWLADDIEGQIKARKGKSLHIYSQEMALMALEHGHDLFKIANATILRAMADNHPALQFCIEEGFQWPTLNTAQIARRLATIWEDKVEEGPLKKLGYTVGATKGLQSRERTRLLVAAFHDDLPRVQSADYMKTWGRNGSRRRLRRMAHFIAWLIRSRKSNPSMMQAVSDWRADLDWIHATLYESWMNFRWPQVAVGTRQKKKRT